jgi:hypothetical protein
VEKEFLKIPVYGRKENSESPSVQGEEKVESPKVREKVELGKS